MHLLTIMLSIVLIIFYNLSIWVGLSILILEFVISNVAKIGLD